MKFKRMDYVSFHKAFGGMKTRGELQEYYNIVNLISKKIPVKRTRDSRLTRLMSYFHNTQYDCKQPWSSSTPLKPLPYHKRKPKIVLATPKKMASYISSHLFGKDRAPRLFVDANDTMTRKIDEIRKAFKFDLTMQEAIQKVAVTGACLVRFYKLNNDLFHTETYSSDVCYPLFDDNHELDAVLIQFVYRDTIDDVDKWFRLELTREDEKLYNNPIYEEGVQPSFIVKNQVKHDFGFVQAEWIINGKVTPMDFDGCSLIEDHLPLIDDINYQVSAQSDAIMHNSMPQLVITGVDQEESDAFLKSPESAWILGKDGEAKYLESTLKSSLEGREYLKLLHSFLSDLSGIPVEQHEQKNRTSTSGVALRILMEGLINVVQNMRTVFESQISSLLTKMAVVYGADELSSVDQIHFSWFEVISDSSQDILQKAQASALLIQNKVISKETVTNHFADDFGIEDVVTEIQKIASESEVENELLKDNAEHEASLAPNNNPLGGKK